MDLPEFEKVVPILRAASTYRFTRAVEWAVGQARAHWSPDLEKMSENTNAGAVTALLLASTYDMPELRKAAMYEVVRANHVDGEDGEFLDHIPSNDGVRIINARAELLERQRR